MNDCFNRHLHPRKCCLHPSWWICSVIFSAPEQLLFFRRRACAQQRSGLRSAALSTEPCGDDLVLLWWIFRCNWMCWTGGSLLAYAISALKDVCIRIMKVVGEFVFIGTGLKYLWSLWNEWCSHACITKPIKNSGDLVPLTSQISIWLTVLTLLASFTLIFTNSNP